MIRRASAYCPAWAMAVVSWLKVSVRDQPSGRVSMALRACSNCPALVNAALTLVNAWHWVGFPTLVFLAGIQRIRPDIIEAGRIDSVSEWQLVSKIIWPLVAPSATVTFILLFIGAFNWFELPYIMVGLDGSPYGSTDVLGLYFYRTAFGNQSSGTQDFGHGSALAGVR